MMSIDIIKKNKIMVAAMLMYVSMFFFNNEVFNVGMKNTMMYLKEMLEIMPAIFVLSGLLNVWVPREVIVKKFGEDSGFIGKLMSILLGAISAGPIYAAFPITQSLLYKGASTSNIVIIISSWAVIKIPMFIVEAKFLGLKFAIIRYCLTIPGILLIGYLTEKLVKREDFPQNKSDQIAEEISAMLPDFNCGSCGYNSCMAYGQAISDGNEKITLCRPGGEKLVGEIRMVVNGG